MLVVMLERDRIGDLARQRPDAHPDAEPGRPSEELAIEIRDGARPSGNFAPSRR